MIGIMAANHNNTEDENVPFQLIEQTPNNTLTGTFIGIGDGFHNVEGAAKVIPVESGAQILRLEKFQSH